MARTHRTVTRKPSIALLHSETRSYRVPLFERLNKFYNITFYFMYGGGWSKQHPESKKWKYHDMRPLPMVGYAGDFSPGIVTQLFKPYDVIITSGLASFATHISFIIAKLTGKKLILWDETWEWPRTLAARIAKPYAKFIVKHADACLAAGTKARDFYISFGADPQKIFIANNSAVDMAKRSIDEKYVQQLRKKYGLEGKQVITYIGRIIKFKGLDFLLKAFVEIEKKNPNAFLFIAGPDAGWEEHCKELARKLGLKNYIFAGNAPHEHVQEYYSLSDVFVLPSRFLYEDNIVNDSWGLMVNEALSLGIPVVGTTAVAAAYDMIENGVSGYQVPQQNIPALAVAIEKSLANKPTGARKAFEHWNNYNTMFTAFKKAITLVMRK
ncbi:glycosyltransferase family 4 protein [Candidatus Woesearchaeota archaeon]|nr:glycosyltransferase family 4 protein [Candidatus Woesearchaeota archaeon]